MDVCPSDIRLSHYLHSSLHCPSIRLSLSLGLSPQILDPAIIHALLSCPTAGPLPLRGCTLALCALTPHFLSFRPSLFSPFKQHQPSFTFIPRATVCLSVHPLFLSFYVPFLRCVPRFVYLCIRH